MSSVLVTGAGGYIGQRLALRLSAEGHAVRALVRTPIAWPPGIEQIIGDLVAQPDLAEKALRNIDTVVHLAGANEVELAGDPETEIAHTVMAARRIAEAGTSHAIYLSTVHVYGDALVPGAVVDEHTTPLPTHPYGISRLACEEIFATSALPTTIFRVTNGVGAPARPDVRRWTLLANDLCRQGAITGALTLHTAGTQWRDFIALSDVESALSDLLGRVAKPTGLINLGSGAALTVRSLAELVQDSFARLGGPRPTLHAPPAAPNPPGPYRIDVARLHELGLHPQTPLADAIDETVRFCQAHRDALR